MNSSINSDNLVYLVGESNFHTSRTNDNSTRINNNHYDVYNVSEPMNPMGLRGLAFCNKIRDDERKASIRAKQIKKKYQELRDKRLAEKSQILQNEYTDDENYAMQLQQMMYSSLR